MEDVIADGMSMGRQQPYAHFISYMIAHLIQPPTHRQRYEESIQSFRHYNPALPEDRCRGLRAMGQVLRGMDEAERVEAQQQDEELLRAEGPHTILEIDSDTDSEEDEDVEYFPPVQRPAAQRDDEAGPSIPAVSEPTVSVPPGATKSELTAILQSLVQ